MFQKWNLTNIFVYTFLIDCICNMMQWTSIDAIDPPFVLIMPLKLFICGCCLWYYFKSGIYRSSIYQSATIVLFLMLVGILRGIFMVHGYWGYKGWVNCVQSAMSFVLLFPLGSPMIANKMLQYWNKYILPLFFLIGLWALKPDAYPFQIPFIYYFYVLLFAIAISNRKALWIIIIGCLCTFAATENRSAIIKMLAAIGLCVTLYFPRNMARMSHLCIHFLFYLLPIIFLVLGLTGTFNIFESITEEEPKEISWQVDGQEDQIVNTSLTADTRTFLYADVIISAIDGDYVLFGHSVGRGNTHSGMWTQDVEGMDSSERLMNEAHMLNIFTWTGLLGIIIYTIMYLQSSCIGLLRSKNRYIPVIACAVAFHWTMLWLEECPSFKPTDFALFLLLGICFSPKFRRMSDLEFELWFRSCFASPTKPTAYIALQKLKLQLLLSIMKMKNEKAKDSSYLL